ncbi:acylphosphatase [Pseudodesulfovibrio piezophilus]|uniref:acylphosphatase n=1 Tax=Pseudodesulfovibrio piezophilus (strain DSM 21447 / JCM 15486 / C1TLV30) TaxID=1322246 RepID=M1WM00_PSEP2|nr:acylphosphatase [Pseudodesulfovibrio piezophilus]CCH48745.1 Acylphosphatase [Pseudodesulfovibrio piezophilus C1TLV30]
MKSYTCLVEGSVTGGNFQSWALDVARQLGLKGWVRNIGDHQAEVLIQSEQEAFEQFQKKLKEEAPIPDLKSVSCKSIDYDRVYEKFEIRG